jgi:hypothetical protein
MGHNPSAKKSARTLGGPIDKLIGYDNVAGRDFLPQAAHGADRDDSINAEFLHGKNVGAKINFRRQPTMP